MGGGVGKCAPCGWKPFSSAVYSTVMGVPSGAEYEYLPWTTCEKRKLQLIDISRYQGIRFRIHSYCIYYTTYKTPTSDTTLIILRYSDYPTVYKQIYTDIIQTDD